MELINNGIMISISLHRSATLTMSSLAFYPTYNLYTRKKIILFHATIAGCFEHSENLCHFFDQLFQERIDYVTPI